MDNADKLNMPGRRATINESNAASTIPIVPPCPVDNVCPSRDSTSLAAAHCKLRIKAYVCDLAIMISPYLAHISRKIKVISCDFSLMISLYLAQSSNTTTTICENGPYSNFSQWFRSIFVTYPPCNAMQGSLEHYSCSLHIKCVYCLRNDCKALVFMWVYQNLDAANPSGPVTRLRSKRASTDLTAPDEQDSKRQRSSMFALR